MITVYHNPKCRKSRAGVQYLQEKGIEIQIVEYLKTPFSKDQLAEILMKLNKRPAEIVRTQEDDYLHKLKGKNFSDDEWIAILLENPRLIQRPIIVSGYRAIIGHTAEAIDALIRE